MNPLLPRPSLLLFVLALAVCLPAQHEDNKSVRVFVFAGQSNMVGADSKVGDIDLFPPFEGLAKPQPKVRFCYCIGRESKIRSDGWVELQPVDGMVGPELSFARDVTRAIKAPIAIVKVAADGTTLGEDWNPDEPGGLALYPLLLQTVRDALAGLDKKRVPWRLEGFVWHQGENDMFDDGFRANYGQNLANFVACVRRDLEAPQLKFYIGELCTKTIWGMDNRSNMYAISQGQRFVTGSDPLAEYVPTSHVGVEIGGGVGLHYHYGTLGQLEHGANHAEAYLRTIGQLEPRSRPLAKWPYADGSAIELFVLAGHRNMEGERAFVQELASLKNGRALAKDEPRIAYRYSVGGGGVTSTGWEPLGPAGPYDTFGPELGFGRELLRSGRRDFAIAKFTHSGSQIVDWTPEGSEAAGRNLYPSLLAFVRQSIEDLEGRGHRVELAGIYYHLGENDMSFHPYRKAAAARLQAMIRQSRIDLGRLDLRWARSLANCCAAQQFA
jgi:hypothetical protein